MSIVPEGSCHCFSIALSQPNDQLPLPTAHAQPDSSLVSISRPANLSAVPGDRA